MLTYESLIQQSKSRGMPGTKIRGILREYLQILILKEISRTDSGRKLFFTGGTYLRLAHNLKRFSEDLDFNTAGMTKKEFETLLEKVCVELERSGLFCSTTFEHWDRIYSARIIFMDVERNYNVISQYTRKAGLIIKVETNRPRWKIKTETAVISGFGEIFPCICTDRGALFADKIDALVKKNRGRHLYDIIFMLSNNYPIDLRVWKTFGMEEAPLDAISGRLKILSQNELQKQAETLRPFLFDESEAGLVAGAHSIVPSLAEKYREYNFRDR